MVQVGSPEQISDFLFSNISIQNKDFEPPVIPLVLEPHLVYRGRIHNTLFSS
jgi:hypothetical protein